MGTFSDPKHTSAHFYTGVASPVVLTPGSFPNTPELLEPQTHDNQYKIHRSTVDPTVLCQLADKD